jgi:biotin-dependent carboxylase-like uncharacterized protein
MSGHLRVLTPGLATTVQDLGRTGFQRLGIPVSGVLDGEALALANAAVGNEAGAAALECHYLGPALMVDADWARVAVAGPGVALEATIDGDRHRVPAAQSVTLPRGAEVRVLLVAPCISAVLAVAGGFAVPLVMGSRSTYARAKLGGHYGRVLQPGDLLPIGDAEPCSDARVAANGGAPVALPFPTVIRVVLGPQDDYFSQPAIAEFLTSLFVVTPASDRMGLRLSGPKLSGPKGFNIVSDSVPPGAIQVPGDGQPIILLADRQTTGGYPKIATVVSADLALLGRAGPGCKLRFEAISIAAAEAAARAAAAARQRWQRLPLIMGRIDEARLYDANLISGVIAADEPFRPS